MSPGEAALGVMSGLTVIASLAMDDPTSGASAQRLANLLLGGVSVRKDEVAMPKGKKPMEIKVGGDKYKAVVLIVEEKDEHQRPLRGTLLYEEQEVAVHDGMEFLVLFMKKAMMKKVPKSEMS